jgi:lipid A 4'-phosphatase
MIRLRTRVQERLAFAVALALAIGVFETWPGLDLWASGQFFAHQSFHGAAWLWVWVLYEWSPHVARVLVVAAMVALALTLVWPRVLPRHWVRRATSLVLIAALGVGLLVHSVLKDNWGRPRPVLTQTFGGVHPFQPALQPTDLCPRNCSFVSGHAAGGFMLLGIGLLGSRRTRWRWWSAGVLAGSTIGLARIAAGGHYLSDIVFSLLALWAVAIVLREVWLRMALLRRRRRLPLSPR